jgi:hypothetical protein
MRKKAKRMTSPQSYTVKGREKVGRRAHSPTYYSTKLPLYTVECLVQEEAVVVDYCSHSTRPFLVLPVVGTQSL